MSLHSLWLCAFQLMKRSWYIFVTLSEDQPGHRNQRDFMLCFLHCGSVTSKSNCVSLLVLQDITFWMKSTDRLTQEENKTHFYSDLTIFKGISSSPTTIGSQNNAEPEFHPHPSHTISGRAGKPEEPPEEAFPCKTYPMEARNVCSLETDCLPKERQKEGAEPVTPRFFFQTHELAELPCK